MNVDELVAIDVHVHLEHDAQPTDTDEAARKYFGKGVAAQGAKALADYYRSRKMACVVFTVDERLTGRPHVTNDDILAFAAANADIAIPFVSVDPTRGEAAVAEARRLVATGAVRGLKLHPPLQQFFPTTAWPTRSTKYSPRPGCRCSFTPATAASAPACVGAAVFA